MSTKNKYKLHRLIKIKILEKRIEELCELTKELDYITYYKNKLIKIYIGSNYDQGIYKIIMRYPLYYNAYDMEFIIKYIKYYLKSGCNDEVLEIILNDNISNGNKMVKLSNKIECNKN